MYKDIILSVRKIFTRKELLEDILSGVLRIEDKSNLIERMFYELLELQLPTIKEDLKELEELLIDLKQVELHDLSAIRLIIKQMKNI
jgi:hypothetical protein